MLLLSSPRWGRVGRASLLLLAAVLLHVTSASPQGGSRCPHHIDCAKAGRHFCKPGSSQCGRCLYPLEENEEGLCVVRKRHHEKVYPDLDEEIDFLHSVIEKQQVSQVKPGKKETSHFAAISFQADVRTTQTHASVPKEEMQNVQTTSTPPSSAITAQPTTKFPQPLITGVGGRAGPIIAPTPNKDSMIVIIILVCVLVGTVAVILATVCAVKLQRDTRLAQKVDYPAFGGATVAPIKANGPSLGDQTLAKNVQMYHYQHQKQQMLSMGKQKPEQKAADTDVTSDEEEVGGDFTVYECPGLAPTGEMEVKNPLFDDSNLHYQGNHK